MRGSRFQKTFLFLTLLIALSVCGILIFYSYDQESKIFLRATYCQRVGALWEFSHKVLALQPELTENIYLEETFDQKILPGIRQFFSNQLKPLQNDRITADEKFQLMLQSDLAVIDRTENLPKLAEFFGNRAKACPVRYEPGRIPDQYLKVYYKPINVAHHFEDWQRALAKLKPLALEVKAQIQNDFQTLCQSWKNWFHADRISHYVNGQCDQPKTKKRCSPEQNEKLRTYASGLESQFQENFAKFKKKWSKITVSVQDMKKRCP